MESNTIKKINNNRRENKLVGFFVPVSALLAEMVLSYQVGAGRFI